jgi:hypothetical protein
MESDSGMRTLRHLGGWIFPLAVSALAAGLLCPFGMAQQGASPRSRIPVVNKIATNGPTRSLYSGSVETLNQKLKILNVSANGGQYTAIFPLTKKTKISSINGQKLKLASLTPGTNVIVYYEQQNARRTVQQIIVLGSQTHPAKKKNPHSS